MRESLSIHPGLIKGMNFYVTKQYRETVQGDAANPPPQPPFPRFKLHCKMINFSVLLLINEILKRYNYLFKLQSGLSSSMRGRKTLRFLGVVNN